MSVRIGGQKSKKVKGNIFLIYCVILTFRLRASVILDNITGFSCSIYLFFSSYVSTSI